MKAKETKLIQIAEDYIQKKKNVEATEILTHILRGINPNSTAALNDLAAISIMENNFQNAMEYLTKVLSLDPQNEIALNNLTYLKQKLDELKVANDLIADFKNNLSIIIPVYNKSELTLNCLRSLNEINSSINYEVIVVDNASTDSTPKEIAKIKSELKYELKYLRNEENLGFAKANNIGAKNAQYENLLFLNNDTLAKKDFLSIPLNYLQNKKIGIVGIKLLYPDNLVQHSGIVFDHLKKPQHIFKFYKSDHPFVNRVYEMQAVTGACLFIRKNVYESAGGFDERYKNGWEDMDLCFKVRELGLKIIYTGETEIYHLESQSEGRLDFAKHNEKLFQSSWSEKIVSDEEKFYQKVREYNSQFSFTKKYDLPHQINFAIKIGVPNRNEKGWGDIYYAESLAKALRNQGHRAVIHYLNEWDQGDKQIDVVIHIKGLSKYNLKSDNINVIWIINHPELHTIEELNQYDLVLAASKKYYEQIKDQINVPCHFLPQATDEFIFSSKFNSDEKDIDILFVGNNYEYKNNRCRKIIDDLIKTGKEYNLHIIGKYWKGFVLDKYIKAEFVDWNDLPLLYGRAKIVLNDHQETMRQYGFINNRTYDLAMMNVFQISNYVEGIDELGVVSYNNPGELQEQIEFYLSNPKEREKKIEEIKNKTSNYTFIKQSEQIIAYLKKLCSEKPIYTKCNICGHEGDDFLDMGARKKVRCPVCNSLERQRALWYLLNRDNMIKPNMKVLEIAPLNNMIYRKYFEEAGCEYICIDKWKHGNPLDKRDTSWIDFEMDVCDLKFEDNTFDLVLMQHVIEEVPDDMKAFSEIARVTKSSGFALLEVPHNKNLQKTIEYNEPQKFGNLRQYGVDFYEKISPLFVYRQEIIIDNVHFSKLGKTKEQAELNFPVILDHPANDKENFSLRFNSAVVHLLKNGFTPLTTAQSSNLIHQNVYYQHPVWLTFDDGAIQDIELAFPILKKNNINATSFLIPNHLTQKAIEQWKSISINSNLDIQNHSLNHFQCFISEKIIGIKTKNSHLPNLMENVSEFGMPIFEYGSSIAFKRFLPKKEVIEEAINFYHRYFELDEEEYIIRLNNHLKKIFGNELGEYESEEEYQARIFEQIEDSRLKLQELFHADIFAFSFPWGQYSEKSLSTVKVNHNIAVLVNPKRINHDYNPYNLERIEITGSAYPELLTSIYTTQPWQKYIYKNQPTVSVLLTTYNRQDLLGEAIQSLIDQTYRDWELIIVNDGGENVSDIVEQFDDPRIKYFNCEHKGKAASLNFAIKNSHSKYIAYLDDDDKYYPNHLEVLISFLETHPEQKFVYSISREVEKRFVQTGWKSQNNIVRYARQASPLMLKFANHIPNLCAVHSRSLFDSAGLYDESLDVLIDWDMYRRFAIFSAPIFINVISSEYSKRTFESNQDKQITGLFFKDPVRYYKNRLRILNKNYPNTKAFIKNEKCVIIICNEKNYNRLHYLIYKIDMMKKYFAFDLILVCDVKLNKEVVKVIMIAEGKNVYVMFNENQNKSESFIQSVIDNNAYESYLLIDEVKDFNVENINYGFTSKNKVINYSKYLRGNYPLQKFIEKKNVDKTFVSIIIPTFNNWNYTQKCLTSIFQAKQNKVEYEIIIVDNCSTDQTISELNKLQKQYKNLKVIRSEKNYGFAIANNIGAKESSAEYLLFLNNDTEVSKDWLDKLVQTSLDKNAAIVGAKLLYPDNTIQHAGIAITEYENQLIAYHPLLKEKNDFVLANAYREFQAVTGACLLIKRKSFFSAGMFDEKYLNGYEDVDLCFKVRENSEKVFYCPEVEIIHHESKTPGRFDNASANSVLLNTKWKGKIQCDVLNQLFTPEVSIVIPIHNQLEYTKKCIDSIRKFTNVPYEIIIVDDASTDNSFEFLSQQKDLIIKKNDENCGYPISCNKGIQVASGKYIVLLNNDTVVTKNWINNLLEVFRYNSSVGLVGPVSNSISGLQLDREAKYTSIQSMHSYSEKINNERKYSWMPTPRIAFVCAVISREVINKIGGLDERFSPGNYEDDDFCLRAQLAGFKTIITNDVFIHHYGSKSFKSKGEGEYAGRLMKNQKIFVEKWGANPDEIWLNNKEFNYSRNLFIPINNYDVTSIFNYAQRLIAEKDYELAIYQLQNALKIVEEKTEEKSVDKEELLLLIGNVFLMTWKYEDAKSYFEKALSENPNSSPACFGLAEVFAAAEMKAEATTMYEWALKNDLYNEKAFERFYELNYPHEINKSEEENVDNEIRESERLIESEKYDEAEENLKSILETNPFNLDSLNNLAVIKIMKNEIDKALILLKRILLIDQQNEIALQNIQYLKSKLESEVISNIQ